MHNISAGTSTKLSVCVLLVSLLVLMGQVEASSARKGVGLVKLMGRQSGFIAMQASMASGAWPVLACMLPHHPNPLTDSHECPVVVFSMKKMFIDVDV